jgi:hypothetical protein
MIDQEIISKPVIRTAGRDGDAEREAVVPRTLSGQSPVKCSCRADIIANSRRTYLVDQWHI